jgi:NAD(P)-dependent dehydrogenase (short-subunit alcohol dehydrogenase family)
MLITFNRCSGAALVTGAASGLATATMLARAGEAVARCLARPELQRQPERKNECRMITRHRTIWWSAPQLFDP